MWYLDGLSTNISRYIIGNKHKLVSTAMLDAIQMESTLKAQYKRSPAENKTSSTFKTKADNRSDHLKLGLCYKCEKQGHLAKDCTEPSNPNKSKFAKPYQKENFKPKIQVLEKDDTESYGDECTRDWYDLFKEKKRKTQETNIAFLSPPNNADQNIRKIPDETSTKNKTAENTKKIIKENKLNKKNVDKRIFVPTNIYLNDKTIHCKALLDSGAEVNVIHEKHLKNTTTKHPSGQSQLNGEKVGGHRILDDHQIKIGVKTFPLRDLYSTSQTKYDMIIGVETCKDLGFLNNINVIQEEHKSESSLEDLKREFFSNNNKTTGQK
jgi:Zinc knuckle